MTVSIVAIVILLLFSAFFSGSETGLTASSKARLHHLEQEGHRGARLANRLREKPERMIGTILLGNNVVNIAASAISTGVLIGIFGEAGVLYATVIMTALVLLFGEVLPKSFAISHPERVATVAAWPLTYIAKLLTPITAAMQWIVSALIRWTGGDASKMRTISVAEELRSALELHVKEGMMVKHESDMLGSILDLNEVTVDEIMVHRQQMQMLDGGQPPHAIVEKALAGTHTRLPVWIDDPENIVGVLHARDLLRAMARPGFDINGLDVMSLLNPPWFVPDTTTLIEQLTAFRQKRQHFALVVDEYGTLKGLVTLEDILEEIVGDIRDEHDRIITGLRPQSDGSYIVQGSVTIRDLNRQFDWDLPDEEATTIAGLVMHEARMIPETGQTFVFHGFEFEVLRKQRHRLLALRIRPPKAAPATSRTT